MPYVPIRYLRGSKIATAISKANNVNLTSEEAYLRDGLSPKLHKFQEPTEVILRGYRCADQQYAAINCYEQLAGRICEDYPRIPPSSNRRHKSELQDPSVARRQPWTPEERVKVNQAAGGEHWVKVTFESVEAAELALSASPQLLLNHLVHAEPWRGLPPDKDEPLPISYLQDINDEFAEGLDPAMTMDGAMSLPDGRISAKYPRLDVSELSGSYSPEIISQNSASFDSPFSTIKSKNSSFNTGFSTALVDQDGQSAARDQNNAFCRTIPTVRKAQLISAENALMPKPSTSHWLLRLLPFLGWFVGSMVGDEVPRKENGDFSWETANLYWRLMYWLDSKLGLFGGGIVSATKDD